MKSGVSNLEKQVEHVLQIIVNDDLNIPFMNKWNNDNIDKLINNTIKRTYSELTV